MQSPQLDHFLRIFSEVIELGSSLELVPTFSIHPSSSMLNSFFYNKLQHVPRGISGIRPVVSWPLRKQETQ